jgi:hypothetical protein
MKPFFVGGPGMMYRGVILINVTPHPITFRSHDGEEFTIEPSGYVISAGTSERYVHPEGMKGYPLEFVKTSFVAADEELIKIQDIKDMYPGQKVLIIGSIIAAQAFPGQVVAMTPAPGFERVPISEKRMNPDKFTVYPTAKPEPTLWCRCYCTGYKWEAVRGNSTRGCNCCDFLEVRLQSEKPQD